MSRLHRLSTVAAAATLLVPVSALAHAYLIKSAPAARATLSQTPPRVDLWFNERLEPAYSTVAVVDGAGRRVDTMDGAVAPDDPRRLSVTLPPLGPGRYAVRFRVLSVDGHVVEASFPFTVSGPSPR